MVAIDCSRLVNPAPVLLNRALHSQAAGCMLPRRLSIKMEASRLDNLLPRAIALKATP